jgi:hypothetical protein
MTSVNSPDDVIAEAKRVSHISSTDELVVKALREFASNHDQSKLIKYLGTFDNDFMADDESQREQ